MQYYDGHTGHIAYGLTYDGYLIDTNPFPTDECDPQGDANGNTTCLTDAQIANELDSFLGGLGLPSGYGNLNPMMLPPSVGVCFAASGQNGATVCSTNSFCAYHGWSAPVSNPGANPGYIYAVEPYNPLGSSGCDFGEDPNGNAADITVNTLSHETNEAITDPVGLGWWDSNGLENGDKCAWNFGDRFGTTGLGQYNQVINGDVYFLQREWSNALNGCYQVGPPTIDANQFPAPTPGGQTVELYGNNFFSASGSEPTVLFNGHPSPDVVVDSYTHLTVRVPSVSGTTGHITIQATGGKVISTAVFGLLPTVTNLSEFVGFAGDSVTVTGTGFFGVTAVKFGGVKGAFSSVAVDGTTLKVVVPAAAVTGNVTVTTAGGTSADVNVFTVKPKIASFTPLSAAAGGKVTIVGTGLSNATVDFTGSAGDATIVLNTATSVSMLVPDDATTGVITVTASGHVASTVAVFKPLPKISSLSIVDGAAGVHVTITGTNLLGTSSVKFGTLPATSFGAVTATSIADAVVPGAPFSSGKVTVVTPGGTAVSVQTFAITKVTTISPTAAVGGTTIAIAGQGLGSTNAVDFVGHAGGVAPVSATATQVKVVVPNDATTGTLTIHTANGATASTVAVFKPLPKISSLSIVDGPAGVHVTITGTNLSGATTVKFGTITATFGTVTPTSIADAIVPGAPFSSGKVTVVTPGGTAVSVQTFAITKVTTISPTAAVGGTTIAIAGQGLGSTNAVDFVGHAGGVAPVSATATQVKVVVPNDATTGTLTIHTANGATASTVAVFKPLPKITSFSPPDGFALTTVTITGTNLTGATTVKFGAVAGTDVTPIDPTHVSADVPGGFASGKITVITPAGSAVSLGTFYVTKAAGFTPASGPTGQTITITGAGLDDATSVDFGGGKSASATNQTATSLKVVVPAGATSGPLTVHTPEGTAATSASFTVTFSVTGFTPSAATYNHDVEITGIGLTGVSAVSVNGLACSITSIASDGLSMHVTTPGSGNLNGPLLVTKGTVQIAAPTDFTQFTVASHAPSSQFGGGAMTFNGTGMAGVTGVTVGSPTGPAGTVDGASPTQVNVTLPDQMVAGPNEIYLTGDGGTLDAGSITVLAPDITSFSPGSGLEGSSVTINGDGFSGVTSVVFGSTAATTYTVNSSIKITATVPSGAVTGTIKVITGVGTATSGSNFTVLYNHTNGLGQTYTSSDADNTFSHADAILAAQAWYGAAAPTTDTTCLGEAAVYIVNGANTQVAVWVYGAGPLQGLVHLNSGGTTPTCPTGGGDPQWN
jgi:IPT/TIG domain